MERAVQVAILIAMVMVAVAHAMHVWRDYRLYRDMPKRERLD